MRSPGRDILVRTARRLEPLLDNMVFVGGQVVELLVTDPAAVRARPTDDVDVIVPLATRSAWHDLQERLAELGFQPDTRDHAPICRMIASEGLILDVMPLDDTILGFTNRWYPYAMETAASTLIAPSLKIRTISAPAFLATKWEAFENRGRPDILGSSDLEDVMTLVAGRAAIVDEVHASRTDVRRFIQDRTRSLLAEPWLEELVDSAVHDARHLPGLRDRVLARFRSLGED